MKILITGARSYVAYYWALALKDKHQIFFADSLASAYCRFAPFASTFIKVAPAAQDFEGFRRDVMGIVARESIDLIIPTCEEVFFLSAFAPELACKVFCPEHELLARLHNKYTVFETLHFDRSIKFPETHRIRKRSDVDRSFNSIIKPVYSRFGANIITDISLTQQAQLDESIEWVQQRRLTGRSLCNYAIAREGRMLGHVCYHGKHRIKHSCSLYLETVDYPAITAFTKAFIAKHNYTGQVAFDFIEASDGIYVIECNPRGTSGLHLMDLNTIEAALFADGPAITEHGQPMAFKFPLRFYKALNQLDTKVGAWFREDMKCALDVLKPPQHPSPGLRATLANLAELLWRRLRQGVKLTEAATYDIEWNGDPIPVTTPGEPSQGSN